MIRNGKAIDHSNVGGLWGSLVAAIVCFLLLLASLYFMGLWTLDNVWIPGLLALALATLAFFIPKAVLGRGDTLHTSAIHEARPAASTQAATAPVPAETRTVTRTETTVRRDGSHAAGDRH